MSNRFYETSNLTQVFFDKKQDVQRLNMVQISSASEFHTFVELRDHILGKLRYPTTQSHKQETYGFTLSAFATSDRSIKRSDGQTFARFGLWRRGDAELDSLSAVYADVDNANTDRPIITPREVETKLSHLGLSFVIYTTYSHTAERPKFRVIIDTDKAISRSEMLRLAVFLNWKVLGHQADLSIYDPGDFLFAPPFECETFEKLDGAPIDVNRMLDQQAELQKRSPGCWTREIERRQPKEARIPTVVEQEVLLAKQADSSVRPEVRIDNPAIFNPAWETLYRDRVSGGHWETMRSLLGMVWSKTQGALSYGEMRHLLAQIDATADGYLLGQYGEAKAAEIINFIMSRPVEPRLDDRSSLLEQDESDLTILVKDAECGQGKTHDELYRIARERGRYVYVCDKIENMDKRKHEFFQAAGRDGYRFFLKEAHSGNELRVPLQLTNIRKDIDKLSATSPVLIFVTQASAVQMDWSAWQDCEIILDEVPDCFHLFPIKAGQHADMLRQHLTITGKDGNCYSVAVTTKGRELARSTDTDDYNKVHHGLCVLLSKPNTHVWVRQAAWDQIEEGGKLEFFALTSPLNLTPFKEVRLLGDEAMNSITVRAWREKWGVNFLPIDFIRRARAVPTADRVTIKYASDHRDSSITRFQQGDMPLTAWTDWIKKDAAGEPVLWTANDKLMFQSRLPQRDYIPPKAHGRNDLQHYTRVAWLAAMKASKFEISALRQICGMTAQELIDWREFNAMYQFVMRGILRDFDSNEPVLIYVFSRQQAEYLHRRLGGKVEKIDGIIVG